MARDPKAARIALVLAGGAARGAYEVGVVQHIVEEVAKDLGRDVPLDILCGTSIGALNACALAAFADEPRSRATRLVDVWTRLRVEQLVQPDLRGILSMGTRWLRGHARRRERPRARGRPRRPRGPRAAHRVARSRSRAIDGHLQRGLLDALTVSTTHVASGRTVVYVHRAQRDLPPWSLDPTITPRAAQITVTACVRVRGDPDPLSRGAARRRVPLRRRPAPERAALSRATPRRARRHRRQPAVHRRAAGARARRARRTCSRARCSCSARRSTRCCSIASTPTSRASAASTTSSRRGRAVTATASSTRSTRRSGIRRAGGCARCARS